MELHERIKYIRKEHLHLTQTKFGEKLGVSRSVINNIERNVLAKPEQKLSLIKLICKEFLINEDWILNGNEPIFIENETFSLDEYIQTKGASDLELEILKAYFDLDPLLRKQTLEHFKNRLASVINTELQNAPSTTASPQVSEKEAEYIKTDSSIASTMESSVSNFTKDIDNKRKKERDASNQ